MKIKISLPQANSLWSKNIIFTMTELVTLSDINLDDSNGAIITDRIEFLLQEISILFDTNKGEVLGNEEFGTDFEQFIWDLSASNQDISSYVVNSIYDYTTTGRNFNITADTSISYGTESDIIIVKISIQDPTTTSTPINAIYRIS